MNCERSRDTRAIGPSVFDPHCMLQLIWKTVVEIMKNRLRLPRCVSTGPVVVRLAEMANEREREREIMKNEVDEAMHRASADAAAVRKMIFQRVASVHVARLKRWDLDSEPHRPQGDSSTGRFAEFQDETQARALDMEEHDTDNDNKLDFSEFCSLVRSREEGHPTDAELQ